MSRAPLKTVATVVAAAQDDLYNRCVDCNAVIPETRPNARRCSSCSKARIKARRNRAVETSSRTASVD